MSGFQKNLYDSNMPFAEKILQSQGLFGESSQLPDVLHCETIAARSSLHDWELMPHRHARLHQVLMLQSGGGQAQIEGETLPLGPMSLINVAAGDVHAFRFEPGTQGYVVTLAEEMMDLLLAEAQVLDRGERIDILFQLGHQQARLALLLGKIHARRHHDLATHEDVVANVHVRREAEFLMDDGDAAIAGLGGRRERDGFAIENNFA